MLSITEAILGRHMWCSTSTHLFLNICKSQKCSFVQTFLKAHPCASPVHGGHLSYFHFILHRIVKFLSLSYREASLSFKVRIVLSLICGTVFNALPPQGLVMPPTDTVPLSPNKVHFWRVILLQLLSWADFSIRYQRFDIWACLGGSHSNRITPYSQLPNGGSNTNTHLQMNERT